MPIKVNQEAMAFFEKNKKDIYGFSFLSLEKFMEYVSQEKQVVDEEKIKREFARYIGGDRWTWEQLDTRERDTLEWAIKYFKR